MPESLGFLVSIGGYGPHAFQQIFNQYLINI